jgi:hypothetical protein
MPRIPQFYKPDYYGWGLQTSLVLCAFNLIWGLILLRVLVWLVEYDLLKIKTTEDRQFKMEVLNDSPDLVLKASQITKVYLKNDV